MKLTKKTSVFLVMICAILVMAPISVWADSPVDPMLILSPEAELTVSVNGNASVSLSDRYPYGETVEIEAPVVTGKTFCYWTNGDGEIVSYANNLSLVMYAHTEVNAVYGDAVGSPESLAAFTSVSRVGETIIFCGIGYAAGGQVSDVGVLYSNTESTPDGLKNLPKDAAIEKSGNCWTLSVAPANENEVYYAIAYAEAGGQTYYSPVKSVKLSGLDAGLSLVANLDDIELPANINVPSGSSSGGHKPSGAQSGPGAPIIEETQHGKVAVSPAAPAAGGKATITATPDEGYGVDTVSVINADGGRVAVTKVNDTTYTYIQPETTVRINVKFKAESEAPAADVFAPYSDLKSDMWYAEGVRYVLENGIMQGMGEGKFEPNTGTTRAQLAQILYSMEGKPAFDSENGYRDVKSGMWFATAVGWASSKGIVGGYGDGKFGPNDKLTREQLVSILYRYAKFKGLVTSAHVDISSYPDAGSVSEWAKEAMQWAVAEGLINGMDGKLNARGDASRAQIATIIMRYCTEIAK
ncbi:MAG: S-layer homology domain-containing protein [Firmicutes bacterium]|nr:S-layer homology domain-containing protein [Bacillota bacterium]